MKGENTPSAETLWFCIETWGVFKEINTHEHKFMKGWSLVLIKPLRQNSSSRCMNFSLSFHTL